MQKRVCSITARAAPTATTHALDLLILFQLLARHAADARAVEVGLFGLDAAEAAELKHKYVRMWLQKGRDMV